MTKYEVFKGCNSSPQSIYFHEHQKNGCTFLFPFHHAESA